MSTITCNIHVVVASARDLIRVKFDILTHGNRKFFWDKKYPICYFTLQSISMPNFIQIRLAV